MVKARQTDKGAKITKRIFFVINNGWAAVSRKAMLYQTFVVTEVSKKIVIKCL